MSEVDGNNLLDSELKKVLLDPSDEVRLSVVRTLNTEPSQGSLDLLIRFLEDKNDKVAAMAVDGVCAYKEESAVRYLLRMFSYPSALVRIHAANCFRKYFEGVHDIQAVIYRKHLALPYIIALLSDPDVDVQVAAEQVLGASETFRGVPPLIEKLSSSNEIIRNEAIRALGLIRDRYALHHLIKYLAKPNIMPDTYALLFIALKRMNYDKLQNTLLDFAKGNGKFTNLNAITRLNVILALLKAKEGVVFSSDKIQHLAEVIYRSSRKSVATAILYANIAELSHYTDAVPNLRPLLRSSNEKVREAVYSASFALAPKSRGSLIHAALRDPSTLVRNHILQLTSANKLRISETFLLRSLEQHQTRLAAINAISVVKSTAVERLLKRDIQDYSLRDNVRVAAINAIGRSSYRLQLPNSWYTSASDDLLIALLNYNAKKLPSIYSSRTPPLFVARYLTIKSMPVRKSLYDFLLSRRELWAKHLVTILLYKHDDILMRTYVIKSLKPDYFPAGGPLLNIARNKSDTLRLEAIRKLRGMNNPKIENTLLTIARNTSDDMKVRILAGSALSPADSMNVLATILRNKVQ